MSPSRLLTFVPVLLVACTCPGREAHVTGSSLGSRSSRIDQPDLPRRVRLVDMDNKAAAAAAFAPPLERGRVGGDGAASAQAKPYLRIRGGALGQVNNGCQLDDYSSSSSARYPRRGSRLTTGTQQ